MINSPQKNQNATSCHPTKGWQLVNNWPTNSWQSLEKWPTDGQCFQTLTTFVANMLVSSWPNVSRQLVICWWTSGKPSVIDQSLQTWCSRIHHINEAKRSQTDKMVQQIKCQLLQSHCGSWFTNNDTCSGISVVFC